jgi:phosphoserine phosphatase
MAPGDNRKHSSWPDRTVKRVGTIERHAPGCHNGIRSLAEEYRLAKMRNVNVFVDVDLTLVDHQGALLPNAVEAMQVLYDGGCHLFLWSTGGSQYCQDVAERAGIDHLFEAFLPKPDIYIDDMPSTIFNGVLFDVRQEGAWLPLAEKILRDHVHPAERRKTK